MPLAHTRSFRVRHYECDAYGHLNNAVYLRYMQEAAFDASAATGYDLDRYNAMNRAWWIRETEIEYLYPLRYNDPVEVKTWVADIRRASSRRMYEFRLAGSQALAARAHSDWVFMDSTSRQPLAIPAEMALAFNPEGTSDSRPPRPPFPEPPPPPPGAFKTTRRVEWQDIDSAMHMNNTVYLDYVSACGFQAIAAYHWPVERMIAESFAIFIRRQRIQYLQQAVLGDEIELCTWASNVRRSTANRHYTLTRCRDGALLARVNSLCVWVDLPTGSPIRIPEPMLADFAPNIVQPRPA
jgi:acyl-CoA thioester hydrolase